MNVVTSEIDATFIVPKTPLPQADGTETFVCEVEEAEKGERLDKFLARRIQTLSRSRLQDLIHGRSVFRNGDAVLDPNTKVRLGETFRVSIPDTEPSNLSGEDIPLAIVYEDDSLLVIDKPAGLVVHPGAGNATGTLVQALLSHCGDSLSGIGGIARPGIVHRLDKDTSGLMVIAKTDKAHRSLADQFADHGRTGVLRREYLALVWGEPNPSRGRIETRIARHPSIRTKMAVVKTGGRDAVTYFTTEAVYRLKRSVNEKPAKVGGVVSCVKCTLETGRTHQVRVHMAHIGTPVIADPVYTAGFQTKWKTLPEQVARVVGLINRQALHAATLRFQHPVSGRVLGFESKPPADISGMCWAFERYLEKVSKI